jgi:hypothetical protein
VSPADLAATIYDALGIDGEQFIPDQFGRPMPLVSGGRPLEQIFGA